MPEYVQVTRVVGTLDHQSDLMNVAQSARFQSVSEGVGASDARFKIFDPI
jgi:hypothetical protein